MGGKKVGTNPNTIGRNIFGERELVLNKGGGAKTASSPSGEKGGKWGNMGVTASQSQN